MKFLNLGCGKDKKEGYVNADKALGSDVVMDMENPWPFQDNDFKEVVAHDVLQQVSSPKKFVFVMNELWRVTEPLGRVFVRVPNAKFPTAFQDPMDVMRFTEDSFTYLQAGNNHYNNYDYGFKPWKVERIECRNHVMMEFMLMPIK